MDFAVGLWRWRLDVLLEERCEPTGMLFGHMGDLSLQDDCNWTLSEDVRTEVNSCCVHLFVLAEFAVSSALEDWMLY